jgi:hypothetical protein
VIYRIRFNKSRGQLGRGTADHVWRIFDETGKETLVKHIELHGITRGAKDPSGVDWNIVCEGEMSLDRNTSTATIKMVDVL